MFVTQQEYEYEFGLPLRIEKLEDVSRVDDTDVTVMTYHSPRNDFAWPRLESQKTMDVERKVFESFGYPLNDYVQSEWQIQVQFANDGDGSRYRQRDIDPMTGLVTRETNWQWTEPATFAYDLCGQVELQVNALGHTITTVTNEVCQVVATETSGGLREMFEYNGFRELRRHTTKAAPHADQVRHYRYDFNSSATDPAEVKLVEERDGTQTVFKTYVDEFGRTWKSVIGQRDPAQLAMDWPDASRTQLDQVYAVTDADQILVEYTQYYRDTGLVARRTDPIDQRGRVSAIVIPATSYQYDEFRRQIVQRLPDGNVQKTSYGMGSEIHFDPLGIDTELVYDTLQIATYVDGTFRGSRNKDAFGQVVSIENADHQTTEYDYDGYNRVKEIIQPSILVLPSGAAHFRRTRPTQRYAYFPNDRVESETDPNGNTTQYQYDDIGRLEAVIGPDGVTLRSHRYDDGKYPIRRLETTDDLGNTGIDWLDAQNRPWKHQATDGAETFSHYDLRGRMSEQVLPWREVVRTRFDRQGQTVETTNVMDAVIATSQSQYDARGNLVRAIDADGTITTSEYDLMNRRTALKLGDPAQRTPLLSEAYLYDAKGRIVQDRINGVVTHYEYDNLDRVVLEQVGYSLKASPIALMTYERVWSPIDRLLQETDGLGNLQKWTFDAVGNQTASEIIDPSGTSLGVRRMAYDANGNVTRETDQRGLPSRFEFDEFNRLAATTPPGLGTKTITYTRNPADPFTGDPTNHRLQTTTAPTGEITKTYVDGEGRAVMDVYAGWVGHHQSVSRWIIVRKRGDMRMSAARIRSNR